MKHLFLLFVVGVTLFSAEAAKAEYLTPEEAGFRNCALIYYNENYKADAFKPILVKYVGGKPTPQPGYDAVLFLIFTLNNKSTLVGSTDFTDWKDQIDIYFHRKINVPALATAVKELREQGMIKERIKVIFSIPWPNRQTHDFGDVDADGKSEDLAKPGDLDKVLSWYIGRVAQEMKAYPELDLWGFYMMNEGLSKQYYDMARRFCKCIHDQGFGAFWIPYYNAAGAADAYELGFDAVVMQSNWTFGVRPDGSGTRRNRLLNTATWAREHHQGIELEINPYEEPGWQSIFARTLETGTQTGFQRAASATYFGSDFYWARSNRPGTKALYSLWMDYLAGKPIVLPQYGRWEEKSLTDGRSEILYRFDKPTNVRLIDLFYRELPGDYFAAVTTVFGRSNAADQWTPLGWKLGRLTKDALRPIENWTISFLPTTVKELRVVVSPLDGTRCGQLVGVEPDPESGKLCVTKSFRKPYTTNKEPMTATYPDESGRDLLDGVTEGSWKHYVGWEGRCPAEVYLDFGEIIDYDEVRLHMLDQRSASITWPQIIEAVSSCRPGIQANAGYGPVPEGLQFACDFRGTPESKVATLKLNSPKKARAMTIRFKLRSWLFLSEIELYKNGKRLNNEKFSYRLSLLNHSPKARKDQYPDDGVMLTDGSVSSEFGSGSVGMNGGTPLTATVDLEKTQSIKRVTCWLIDGHGGGVRMPKKGKVRFSTDGKVWSDPTAFTMPPSQKSTSNRAVPVSVSLGQTARYVQVEFSTESWTFLSEITVE